MCLGNIGRFTWQLKAKSVATEHRPRRSSRIGSRIVSSPLCSLRCLTCSFCFLSSSLYLLCKPLLLHNRLVFSLLFSDGSLSRVLNSLSFRFRSSLL